MECPECHEEHGDPLGCEQCGSLFCTVCQPWWDYTSDLCQNCQERNSIAALREDSWTARLRQWFNPEADLPVAPELEHPLPWKVGGYSDGWLVHTGENTFARFDSKTDAEYAVAAANSHHDLALAVATTYNRIRSGAVLWNGTDDDLALWMRVKQVVVGRKQ